MKLRDEPPGFAEWYAAFPRHVARIAAAKAYRTALGRTSSGELFAGAQRYAAAMRDADSDKIKLSLHSGWNSILLKITQLNQGWEFCARLRNPDGSPLDGLQCEGSPQEAAK